MGAALTNFLLLLRLLVQTLLLSLLASFAAICVPWMFFLCTSDANARAHISRSFKLIGVTYVSTHLSCNVIPRSVYLYLTPYNFSFHT